MKELRLKAHKFRLNPNKEQRIKFAQFAGCARYVFNHALASFLNALNGETKLPTYNDAAKKLPQMKESEETAWLKEVHSQILQQALMHLYKGITKFFKERISNPLIRLPRFKRKGRKESFRYPQNIKVEDGKVFLPKIGWVRYRDSRTIEGSIKQAVIKKEAGHWYIIFFVEVEIDTTKVPIVDKEAVGIDLGLLCFAALSNGETIQAPAYLKKHLDKLRRLNKELSRKKKFSRNWYKCVAKIQRLHIRIKNLRNDFLHKLSTLLSKNHGVVCMEDLNIKGMVKNSRLARSISDAAWGRFVSFLEYKCDWTGKHFVKVPRWFPSSKLCSSCGNKQDMPLHKREYHCKECGLVLDRDINASKNIRMAGLSILKACGAIGLSQRTEAGITGF